MNLGRRGAWIALAVAATAATVGAQCQVEKLVPDPASAFDLYGCSVHLQGDYASVGAIELASGGPGYAIMYERIAGTWTETQRITPPDGGAGDEFGHSVRIDGDRFITSSPFHDVPLFHAGAAYVYERDGAGVWQFDGKLIHPSPEVDDFFGTEVAIEGDRAVVTGLGNELTGVGSAVVYERGPSGWSDVATLTGSPLPAHERFGRGVALEGDRIVVGAPQMPGTTGGPGSVYVYETDGSGWTQTAHLSASNGVALDWFGWRVALRGDTLVVGSEAEQAYVFEYDGSTWTEDQILTAAGGSVPGSLFGKTVAISGDRIVLGAEGDDGVDSDAGSAYLFEEGPGGWAQIATLQRTDAGAIDQYGVGVALDGTNALVGAMTDNSTAIGAGSAYLWSVDESDCPQLYTAPDRIFLSQGGFQVMTLRAGAEHAGKLHWVIGSATGTSPGVPGVVPIPLNFDSYFVFTFASPNTLILNSLAFLDGEGESVASITLPAGLDPTLAGAVLHHAYLVLNVPGGGQTLMASNPRPLLLLP